MRKEKFNKKEIEIAETVKDISLIKLINFVNTNKKNNGLTDFKVSMAVLLTSLTEEEIEDAPYEEVKELLTSIDNNILNFEDDFVSEYKVGAEVYTANLKDGKPVLKMRDLRLIEDLVKTYNTNYVLYIPSIFFRKDHSIPLTIDEVISNKEMFTNITTDIIAPYIFYISNLINEKGN